MPTIKDLISTQVRKKRVVEKVMSYLEREGYTQIEPDYIESYQAFLRMNPSLDDTKLVKFSLPDGGLYTLRPDITTHILSQYIPLLKEKEVCKLSYSASYFRQNASGLVIRPQLGFECFGPVSFISQMHMLSKMFSLFKKPVILILSYPSFIDDTLSSSTLSNEEVRLVKEAVRLKNSTAFKTYVKDKDLLKQLEDYVSDLYQAHTLPKDALPFKPLLIELENISGLSYKVDFSLIAQYDYYSGMYIEGYMEGYSKPILSGGSYNKRTALYGKETEAFGISFDVDMLVKEVWI